MKVGEEKVWRVAMTWRGSPQYHAYGTFTVLARTASEAYSKGEKRMTQHQRKEAYISMVELIAEPSK